MPGNKDEQVAALKDLLWWVGRHGPDIRKWTFGETEGEQASAKLCLKEVAASCLKHARKKYEAEQRLLASGYQVPDHWLQLHAGQVAHSWETGVGTTITVVGVDDAGLDRAEKEISLAVLRLEYEPAPAGGDGKPAMDTPDPATPPYSGGGESAGAGNQTDGSKKYTLGPGHVVQRDGKKAEVSKQQFKIMEAISQRDSVPLADLMRPSHDDAVWQQRFDQDDDAKIDKMQKAFSRLNTRFLDKGVKIELRISGTDLLVEYT